MHRNVRVSFVAVEFKSSLKPNVCRGPQGAAVRGHYSLHAAALSLHSAHVSVPD